MRASPLATTTVGAAFAGVLSSWVCGCSVDYDQLRGRGVADAGAAPDDAGSSSSVDRPSASGVDASAARDAASDLPGGSLPSDGAASDSVRIDATADVSPADSAPSLDATRTPPDASESLFARRKSVTIDRMNVGEATTTTLANYPLLFSVVDPDLRGVASGGRVASIEGHDIAFRAFSASTCGGPPSCTLDHEIEAYVPATGQLVAWVRVPVLNGRGAAASTVLFIYYGAPSMTRPSEKPASVWDAGFGGVWHFKESLGGLGALKDSTANKNHGTTVNRVKLAAAGPIGPAIELDGLSAYVEMPDSDSLDLEAAGSVSLWYRSNNTEGWRALVNKGPLTNNIDASTNYAIEIDPMDQLAWYVGSATQSFSSRSGPHAHGGSFHHVAMVWDQVGMRRYVDGVLIGSAVPLTVRPTKNAIPLRIGVHSGELVDPFTGGFDEVRVSTARSSAWIITDFRNQSAPGTFVSVGAAEDNPP